MRPDLRLHEFACMYQPAWREALAKGGGWPPHNPIWSGRPHALDIDCGGAAPPPEIRDDPGRVRFWNELRERRIQEVDACHTLHPCTVEIAEVEGCGIRRFYGCDPNVGCFEVGGADPKGSR
jgi:hypothetical protein